MDKLITSPHFTVWGLIKTYWQSEHKHRAVGLYLLLVILTITLVGGELAINYWYNYFYDALQTYNEGKAIMLIGVFFAIAFGIVALVLVRYYVWQIFGLHWRRWLTEQMLGRWLKGRGYYFLENFDDKTDNPDQRIQDDVGGLIASSIDLSISLIGTILSVVGYGYVLWSLSGDVLHIPLGRFGGINIHGYLLWVAVVYSLIGTLITMKIGRPLISLNFEQQRREATFRFAAIDLRSHAEQVALYHGEHHQRTILQRLFGDVLDNWYQIIVRQTKLLSFTTMFGQLSVALPLIVIMPIYFKKAILIGGLMQSLKAFSNLQDGLAFIVNSFSQIAQWRATGQRLTTFLNHLDEVEDTIQESSRLHIDKHPTNTITTKDVSIQTPRKEQLISHVNETFIHGQHYLIKGPSGLGKSTFIRAIAGIWPFTDGKIILPEKKHIMYIPQQTYMPIGTLSDAILFPDHVNPELVKRVETVLRDCRLAHLIPRLQDTAPWSEHLSPGEQQRIGFARVLLHKPDWVFLDESTSQLDIDNEKYMYQLIKEKLPGCSIVSVGHRPTLDMFHDHIVDMTKYSAAKVTG